MQELNVKINDVWTPLSDLITIQSGVTYNIQNQGVYDLMVVEKNSLPTENEGCLLRKYDVLRYKLGTGNLYLKAQSNSCVVNIF